MPLYQPNQILSWKYNKASGQLIVVSKISVDLGPNEAVSVTATPISNQACTITLTVLSGLNNTPVTKDVYYTNIGAGLSTESAVRSRIATLPPVTVSANVVKNGVSQGSTGGVTNSNATIIIE